jgi:hypothetical protein
MKKFFCVPALTMLIAGSVFAQAYTAVDYSGNRYVVDVNNSRVFYPDGSIRAIPRVVPQVVPVPYVPRVVPGAGTAMQQQQQGFSGQQQQQNGGYAYPQSAYGYAPVYVPRQANPYGIYDPGYGYYTPRAAPSTRIYRNPYTGEYFYY